MRLYEQKNKPEMIIELLEQQLGKGLIIWKIENNHTEEITYFNDRAKDLLQMTETMDSSELNDMLSEK